MTLARITPKSERVYTMADRPPEVCEELWQQVIEQGVVETSNYEHLVGIGEDLWDSDEDLDRFLESIRASRKDGG